MCHFQTCEKAPITLEILHNWPTSRLSATKKKKKKKKERKPVFIKQKRNHLVFSRATILSFNHISKVSRFYNHFIYIQNQINKIRDSVEDRRSRVASQTVNQASRRKSTAKAKMKATSQEVQILQWKLYFGNLLGKPPKVTQEPITKILSNQLDIKLWQFTQDELDSELREIKNRKAARLDEILPEVWKTREFDNIRLRHCNSVYNQNTIDRWTKGCILSFPKKGDIGIAKNYRGIIPTSIEARIYNALQRNGIEPKTEKIHWKDPNGFRRNCPTTSYILTIRRILGVRAKQLEETILFFDFSKAFDSILRGKIEQILLTTALPKKTGAAIMMQYKNTKVKVRFPDRSTDYFDIIVGVLKGDT